MPDSLIGRQIDNFVIEERIGQGAMATVYGALESSINRRVALKVIQLNEGQGQHEDFRKRFAHEAATIAKLEHIHILPIYAYGINEEFAYLAMRWLKGGSLSQLLRKGKLPLDRAADIFGQIAKGLAYAHSKGVIHRDLKPSNIMLDDTGNAYLTDFGLAKLVESSSEITRTGTIVGTPAYMSPEQLRGETLDYRSDIYSLGVILYTLMAGRLPFDTTTSNVVSVIYQHLEKPPLPPRELNPDIPPAVEAVIMKALEKDRNARYSNPLEMSHELNVALGRPGSSDSQTDIPPPRHTGTSPTISLRRKISGTSLGFSVIILILIAMFAFIVVQNNNTNRELQAQQTFEAGTAAAAAATNTAALWTATPLPEATVLIGKKTSLDKILPNDQQIALAKARLGKDGFVAYITCNQDSEFHAVLAREIRDLATRYHLAYRVYDSASDKYKQITLVEKARADGATALMICPLDPQLLADTLTSVQQAHIPLVLFADDMSSYGGVLIGGDNYLLGLEPGKFAGQIVRDEMGGKAEVITLDYPSLDYLVARANGLEDGLKQFAPDAHIIGRYLGATKEFAQESVGKLIQDGVKFNMILSINDAGSFGAIAAMQAAGWDCKSVVIVSVDAEVLAQQYIRDGCFIRGSAQAARREIAEAMVNAAVQLLSGSTIAETVLFPPGPVLTKETLEQYDAATATVIALTPTATSS